MVALEACSPVPIFGIAAFAIMRSAFAERWQRSDYLPVLRQQRRFRAG
jgi:hypothetical protein